MGRPGIVTPAGTATLTRGLLPVQRRAPTTRTNTSLDGSVKETIRVGQGYVEAIVQPDDLGQPLRDWLAPGRHVKGEYRPDTANGDRAVSVLFYVLDPSTLDDPAWYQRPLRIRLVPTDGATLDELLEALGLDGLAKGIEG